jgi:hypothetical protein
VITSVAPAARSSFAARVCRRQLRVARRHLEAHLGEHGELAGEPADIGGLFPGVHRQGAVADLDEGAFVVPTEPDVVVEAGLGDVLLQQRAAEEEADPVLLQGGDLGVEVRAHHRRAPAELHEVDVLGMAAHHVPELADRKAAVDDHGQPLPARLASAGG